MFLYRTIIVLYIKMYIQILVPAFIFITNKYTYTHLFTLIQKFLFALLVFKLLLYLCFQLVNCHAQTIYHRCGLSSKTRDIDILIPSSEVYQWSISTLVFFELFRQDSFIQLNGRKLFWNFIIAARMWTTAFMINIFN
jgi:hypothetical protein